MHPILNPLPKISAYIRRKSESYLSRRRSDEARYPIKTGMSEFVPQFKKTIKEEESNGLRENVSHNDLAKPTNELL